MPEIGDLLPPFVASFCSMFPSARLCRIMSCYTGTLLDVKPSLDLTRSDIPRVVLNPESAGIQYWLITPHGDGQAFIPVPQDGSQTVRYLTPSSFKAEVTPTVSPFPVSWNIIPVDSKEFPGHSQPSVVRGLYEEWNCIIHYPHFANNTALLPYGSKYHKDTNIDYPLHIHPFGGQVWYFWTLQFIRYQDEDDSDEPSK